MAAENDSITKLKNMTDEEISQMLKDSDITPTNDRSQNEQLLAQKLSKSEVNSADLANQSKVQVSTEEKITKLMELKKLVQQADEKLHIATFLAEIYKDDPVTEDQFASWFLAGKKWNVQGAFEKLEKFVIWRRDVLGYFSFKDVESELKTGKATILFLGDTNQVATDKSGRLLFYYRPRLHTPGAAPVDSTIKAIVYLMERALRMKETSDNGFSMFTSPRGAGWSNFDRNMAQAMQNAIVSKMPIRLGATYIYEPPWFFSILFGIIKTFSSAKFVKRLKPISTLEELQQFVPNEAIPTELGGQNTFDPSKWISSLH